VHGLAGIDMCHECCLLENRLWMWANTPHDRRTSKMIVKKGENFKVFARLSGMDTKYLVWPIVALRNELSAN
jgi:hypothetical protein